MDLTKILEKGHSVYCPMYGYGVVDELNKDKELGEITVHFKVNIAFIANRSAIFTGCGNLLTHGIVMGENISDSCMLFPDKGVYTWENYSRFKPGQVVLVWNKTERFKKVRVFYIKQPNGLYTVTSHLDPIDVRLIGSELEHFDHCEEYNPELVHFSNVSTF